MCVVGGGGGGSVCARSGNIIVKPHLVFAHMGENWFLKDSPQRMCVSGGGL